MFRMACIAIYSCIVITGIGCAVKKIELDFDQYTPAPLEAADILPSKEEVGNLEKPTVVVFGYDNTNSKLTQAANIKTTMVAKLENYMANIGVDLVSRQGDQSEQLREELKLYRVMSEDSGIYNGLYKADYFIMNLVNSVNTKNEYKAPDKEKEREREGKCQYTAIVTGSVRVYNMSERKIVKDIRFEQNSTENRKAATRNCPLGDFVIPLIQESGDKSLASSQSELKNYFTSRGYITERRVKEDENIFKISMGRNNNLRPRDKIQIYTKRMSVNKLMGTTEMEVRRIAEGEVTDFIVIGRRGFL